MDKRAPVLIRTISDYHRLLGLPKPEHPLVSLSRFEDMPYNPERIPQAVIHTFYSIALKKTFHARLKYGQQEVDFDEGVMLFMAPRQVLSIEGPHETTEGHTGWLLLVHPDLLWNTPLATKIRQYDYFDYKANEALHVSESEQQTMVDIMQQIAREYRARLDNLSQDIIVAQLELLLTYAERFYQRQFISRRVTHHPLLNRMEALLKAYINSDRLPAEGMPPVTYFADALHVSPNYLSRLLKTLTGQSTRQFIIDNVIDLAKEKLSTTDLSMNEIAFALGFAHPQSFSKLFKSQTSLSPLQFRQSVN